MTDAQPKPGSTAGRSTISASNRFGMDYRLEARLLGPPPASPPLPPTLIIDAHTHINGRSAAGIYREVCDLYGVAWTCSQTRMSDAAVVKSVLQDRVKFVAVPDFANPDRAFAHTEGFLDQIRRWHGEFGSRMVKFWNAPRLLDYLPTKEATASVALDGPWRIKAAEVATGLGMNIMCHIADPDTWFATKYADASRYGTKRSHYEPLERMLDRFGVTWQAAHMGGWPEDLAFLDGLLERHSNLVLDTSATKWMVRELSRHTRDELVLFLSKWRGRILFGSDIVTTDDHLQPAKATNNPMGDLADSPASAFDLYASRYWALRTMWETEYAGESPIADPDLMMVEPRSFDAMSAPALKGFSLPADLLRVLYHDAAESLHGGR